MGRMTRLSSSRFMTVIIIIMAVFILGGSFFTWRTIKRIKTEADQNINVLQQKVADVQRSGYVAAMDIKLGEMLTEQNVLFSTEISSSTPQDLFITESDIGKIATCNVAQGQPVLKNMVTQPLENNYHERECSFIWLSSNLKDYDYVDLRILFENGEDYVVAAKKAVRQVSIAANNCFIWLTEEEILSLDAAIVDANLHGAKIYTTKYVEPALQEASTVNYNPNNDVIKLMRDDPNIVTASARELSVKARNAMEKRVNAFKEAYPDYEFNDTLVEGADKTSDADKATEDAGENYNAYEDTGATSENEASSNNSTNTEQKEVDYID